MDKDMLMKMMGKKKEKEENPDMKKDAKLNVLKELRKMASDMMGEDVKGGMAKKVTVMAPDKEGLKDGLKKAENMLGDFNLSEGGNDEEEMESAEEMDEDCDTPEEIDAKIAELQALKARLK